MYFLIVIQKFSMIFIFYEFNFSEKNVNYLYIFIKLKSILIKKIKLYIVKIL